jgi:hypothetical protein
MEVRIKEVLRYLRMREERADEKTLAEVNEVIEELTRQIHPGSISRRYPCTVTGNGVLFADCRISSRSLAAHLKGCRELYLFAATLGPAPDRLVSRFRVCDTAKMVIVQAAAAAMIESFCNEEQRKLSDACRQEGLYLKPRFSPGYGDCPLSCQKELFQYLDITKSLGVSLTEGDLMVPTKSVTAWIGITDREECYVGKCRRCSKSDCEFREVENEL